MNPVQDKQFLETILSSIADGVFTLDQEWRITSVPASEAIGKRCSEVFHADICEQKCALRQTMETGRELIDYPAKILSVRGRSLPITLSTAVLRNAEGTPLGAVETFLSF